MRDITTLQAYQSTFPHVQTVHTDITKKNRKGSGRKPTKRTGQFQKRLLNH